MKILSKILVLLLTAGVSSSCLSHLKYDKTTGEIRLRPVVGLGTRSGEDFIPFPEDREFRVTAVSRDSGEKYLDDVMRRLEEEYGKQKWDLQIFFEEASGADPNRKEFNRLKAEIAAKKY